MLTALNVHLATSSGNYTAPATCCDTQKYCILPQTEFKRF